MKKISILFVYLIALVVLAGWAPHADAYSDYYTSRCDGCHYPSSSTCAGCHIHGVYNRDKNQINVIAITDFDTYAPGEMVTVSISGGYRAGWVRTILYDENGVEVSRSAGPDGYGDGPGFPGPIDLTAPAPTMPGAYRWTVAWYGNNFGSGGGGSNFVADRNNPGHGEERVATNEFVVVAGNTAPVAVDDPAKKTPANTPLEIDVLANDTDADNLPPARPNDGLTVNSFDTASAAGARNVDCSLTANAGSPQCTYTPPQGFCGSDTFTYDATDGTDVSDSRATVTIVVGDANAPLVTAPASDPLEITVAAGTTSVPATDPTIAAWLAAATANDAEEGDLRVDNNAPANFALGSTPVTFSAADSCGNKGSATATVSVVAADNNTPLVTAPMPDRLYVTAPLCATSVVRSATADNFTGTIADWLAASTAEDLEDGPLTVANDAPIRFSLGETPVSFSATDLLGASATAAATVYVAETPNTEPVVTPPASTPLIITVPAGTTSVPATDPTITDWLASATATDDEDGLLNISDNAPREFPLGITTVIFTASDACGLQSSATAQVTIQEEAGNTAPVVTVPDSITVTAELCAESVSAADPAIAAWLDSAAADDAEDGSLPVSDNAPADFPAAAARGTTTRVDFSATDSAGLTTSVPAMLTVIDPNTAPVVTAPTPDPLIILVPAGTISVPATEPAIAAWLATATATDAEDGSLGVSNDAPADFSLGMTMVTFSAGDGCGLTATGSARVTIQIEAFCGDGNRDADEACDDGNNVDGDGCAADCTVEIPPDPLPDDLQVEVEVREVEPGQVKLKVEFDEMVELETLVCGPAGGALVPPLSKEVEIEHDETEVKALFAIPDDQCGDRTSFVCQGYLTDGRSFMGTSQQFQTECKDDGGEREEDDEDHSHGKRDKHDKGRGGWKEKLRRWLW